MNLGTGRILILVALVVVGVVVLANGFPESGGAVAAPSASSSSPGASTSPTGGGSTSPQPTATPSPEVQGVTVMALNGTNTTGAAAAAQAMLVDKGYTAPVAAADAPNAGVSATTVYYRTGADAAQNKSNATHMAKKYFNDAPVKKLDETFADVVPTSVSLVVVVGEDYASTLTP